MSSVIYIGDIHGNFSYLEQFIRANIGIQSNLVQVGDFGLGFSPKNKDYEKLYNLNKALNDKNSIMYVIRGNHDNPSYWDDIHFEYNFSNLRLVKDFEVLSIDGVIHLFIGGAVSIDRTQRREGVSWWKDEILSIDKVNTFNANQPIDVVVTHNAPDFCYPQAFNELVHYYLKFDPSLENECKLERATLTNLFSRMVDKPKYWFYGHYHDHNIFDHEGTRFRLLNVNEFYDQYLEIQHKEKKY